MDDYYDMKKNISARRILILLVLLLSTVTGLVIFASCNSDFALKLASPHSFYVTFPRLSEERGTLTSKNETYQYVFSHDDWGPWMTPGINVTFQLNATGDLMIEECTPFIAILEENMSPQFVLSGQEVEINGDKISVSLAGYFDNDDEQREKINISFDVKFLPLSQYLDIHNAKEKVVTVSG